MGGRISLRDGRGVLPSGLYPPSLCPIQSMAEGLYRILSGDGVHPCPGERHMHPAGWENPAGGVPLPFLPVLCGGSAGTVPCPDLWRAAPVGLGAWTGASPYIADRFGGTVRHACSCTDRGFRGATRSASPNRDDGFNTGSPGSGFSLCWG